MRFNVMRTGITFQVSSSDRLSLERLAKDRNAPQKHVWRASIILLSADGLGTAAIMRRTGKSKTCVWRWQERFMSLAKEPSTAFSHELDVSMVTQQHHAP